METLGKLSRLEGDAGCHQCLALPAGEVGLLRCCRPLRHGHGQSGHHPLRSTLSGGTLLCLGHVDPLGVPHRHSEGKGSGHGPLVMLQPPLSGHGVGRAGHGADQSPWPAR